MSDSRRDKGIANASDRSGPERHLGVLAAQGSRRYGIG